MRLLYFCPVAEGGLAEYALHQAGAISREPGLQVLWHAPESLDAPLGLEVIQPIAVKARFPGRSKLRRGADFLQDIVGPHLALAREIDRHKPDAVLLAAWGEYFAPLWAPGLRRRRDRGVLFAAVVHDPVRSYQRGPGWWHRWSVREAYSFLDLAFVHEACQLDMCGARRKVPVIVVPHGPYPVPHGQASRSALRKKFHLPEQAQVLLSFGHIRDGKNLDQVLQALIGLTDTHLLVAGRTQSAGQKPVKFYQDLASRLGVADRCHWHDGFVRKEDVWEFFSASDVCLLLYGRDFHSASGVLNVNAQFQLPVLASGGSGPLLRAVEHYRLGVVLPECSPPRVAAALREQSYLAGANWESFQNDHSWEINAGSVAQSLAASLRPTMKLAGGDWQRKSEN